MPGDLISGVCLMEYIKSLHFEKCFLTSKYPYIGRVFIDCCYLAKRKERKSKGREDMWVRILNRSSQQNTTYIDQKDISLKIQITQKMLGLHKKQITKEVLSIIPSITSGTGLPKSGSYLIVSEPPGQATAVQVSSRINALCSPFYPYVTHFQSKVVYISSFVSWKYSFCIIIIIIIDFRNVWFTM